MYSLLKRFLTRIATSTFIMTLLTVVGFMPTVVSAQEQRPAIERLSQELPGFVGFDTTDRVLSLIEDSRNELKTSFKKNPKRREAFSSLINDCIRVLDGADFVPQACKVLFGAFPEVDRVFSYVVQAKLSDEHSSAVAFPREFNDILNGLICGLCPTATCETPRLCERF